MITSEPGQNGPAPPLIIGPYLFLLFFYMTLKSLIPAFVFLQSTEITDSGPLFFYKALKSLIPGLCFFTKH
ncbi:hypothetical protein BHU16_00105 [Tannerella sp. oral taxon 808]|nr:hypothetical protein BHU16_00105 [Tannerella sp. oral taxon 808]